MKKRRKHVLEKLKDAIKLDGRIMIMPDEVEKAEGFSEDYLLNLGLEKRDLKWLERHQLAIRGYTFNGYKGKFGPGSRLRWIILAPKVPTTILEKAP